MIHLVELLILFTYPIVVLIDAFVLDGKSFQINSSIYVQGTNFTWRVRVDEYYSSEQRRSKLIYTHGRDQFELYYDAMADRTIERLTGKFARRCKQGNVDDFYATVFNEMEPEMSALFKQDVERGGQNKLGHIIGPARLLFLAAFHAEALERSAMQDPNRNRIRNHETVEYKLSIELENRHIEIYLYYDKSVTSETSVTDAVPLYIRLNSLGAEKAVFLDFYHYKVQPPAWFVAEKTPIDLTSSNDKLILDQTTLPLSVGCMGSVDNRRPISLYDSGNSPSTRSFSFEGSSWWNEKELRHFVAYDGASSLVRIDSFKYRKSPFGDSNVHDRTRILNLRTNRKFLVDLGDHITVAAEMQSVSMNGEQPNRCVMSYIEAPSNSSRSVGFNTQQFLFGEGNFDLMGRARVNGVDALVFEGLVADLPDWFVQPLLINGKSGEWYKLKSIRKMDEKIESVFVCVVFVAAIDKRPLQMSIYDSNLDLEKRRVLSVEFRNFIWDLNESPDGTARGELFSLGELCRGPKQVDYEVEILARLVSSSESSRWIDEANSRNTALRVGLLETLDVCLVDVSDLESRLIGSSGKRAIAIKFRLEDRHNVLTRVRFMGRARFVGKLAEVNLIESNSLADCLWMAGASSRGAIIYFASDTSVCISATRESDTVFSRHFQFEPNGYGELFRVDQELDTIASLSSSWLNGRRLQHLRGRPMSLKAPGGGGQNEPLKLVIERARVRQMNYLAANASSPGQILEGFVFSNSNSFVKLVELNATSDTRSSGQMSFGLCEAACLSDLDCKSFAYCDVPNPKCITSTISVPIDEVLGRISQNVRGMSHGSKVNLELGTTNLELFRDVQCEIANKNYLDLFHRTSSARAYLREAQIFRNEDRASCAEKCFATSLEVIKECVGISEQLNELMSKQTRGPQFKRTFKELLSLHRELEGKFCKTFMFLDSALSDEQLELIGRLAVGDEQNQAGYCILENSKQSNHENTLVSNVTFEPEYYDFDFTSLYDKQPGIALMPSILTEDEQLAYDSLRSGKALQEDKYELVRDAMAAGKNFVTRKDVDVFRCARLCFTQASGVWPACNSFDMIHLPALNESEATSCRMHTQSIEGHRNLASDSQMDTNSIRYIHYEPRFDSVRRMVRLSFLVAMDDAEVVRGNEVRFGVAASIVVCLVGIVSGAIFGASLAPRLVVSVARSKERVASNADDLPRAFYSVFSPGTNQERSYVRFEGSNFYADGDDL